MTTNEPHLRRTAALAVLVIAGSLATPLMAQQSAAPNLLPGGASSLSEAYGDWTVRCQVIPQDAASKLVCVMGQRQTNEQGQQVLSIEFLPSPDGLEGAIVLPFGLAVTQPVALTIDEGEAIAAAFSTCVPNGCVVPMAAGSGALVAMRAGTQLTVAARSVNGQTLELPVSLAGFAAASNRVDALTQ